MSQKMYSISYLDALWRKAVRMLAKGKCFKCGQPGSEAHHIIRRGKKILKWDIKNGMYLCHDHHVWADTTAGRMWVYCNTRNMDYLIQKDIGTYKDYLVKNSITDAEFRAEKAQELKEIIKEHGGCDE